MSHMLDVRNLTVYYGYVGALSEVSLYVDEGEIITLIGSNGAGKTTTLMSISGLVEKAGGSVIYRDQDITRMNPDRIVKLGISHVPEGRKIFPQLTVYENLIAGTFGKKGITKAQIAALGAPAVLLGDGAYLLADLADGDRIILSEKNFIKGAGIAKAAMHLEARPPEELIPAYFRLSQAEREYQQRKGEQK